jgi:H+-translocating NAD(P) transhydrogenase subunit beta
MGSASLADIITGFLYLISAGAFILSLRWMSSPETARRAVLTAVAAMLLAVAGTLFDPQIVTYKWIVVAAILGTIVGYPLSRVPLTAVPERTGLSQSFAGMAAALVGAAKYYLWVRSGQMSHFRMTVVAGEVILGCLTATGGLLAAGKLAEWIPTRPLTYKGQNVVSFALLAAAVVLGAVLIVDPTRLMLFPFIVFFGLIFGVMLLLPIGGADMPVVISFLNSFSGLSAVAMGFVLENKLLITAGALDGSSGFVLSVIMCRAMNRSVTNVLFGAFGAVQTKGRAVEQRTVKSATATDAAELLANADSVVIIPGYGMAVAQAQHRVRDLYDQLAKRGVDVKFAVHPVAGRMPGHMNVLLAEADIPYDRLVEMDDINPEMPQVGVALVIGANDVVNPAARSDTKSPIYGMPIIDADKAQTVLAIKRTMNPGFAGIDNDLYYANNTLMLFGDAKQVIGDVVKALAGEGH